MVRNKQECPIHGSRNTSVNNIRFKPSNPRTQTKRTFPKKTEPIPAINRRATIVPSLINAINFCILYQLHEHRTISGKIKGETSGEPAQSHQPPPKQHRADVKLELFSEFDRKSRRLKGAIKDEWNSSISWVSHSRLTSTRRLKGAIKGNGKSNRPSLNPQGFPT